MTFGPDDWDQVNKVKDELVTGLHQWADRLDLSERDQVAPDDLGLMLDWKHGYTDGRLAVWRRQDIDEFLLDWCPRKLTASTEDARSMPASIALAFRYLADQDLLELPSDPVDVLAEHTLSLQDQFLTAMSDPANFGMAKSLFGSLDLDLDNLTEPELNRVVQDLSTRSPWADDDEFEDSLVDLSVTDLMPQELEAPDLGRVRMPSAQAVRESAAAAPVLAAFGALAEYFASPGRPLTQAGNMKLADARALIDILETGESLETEIGDRTWRTGSATRLPNLDHWQWWATQSGAIRRRGTKLVGVKAWQQRCASDPVREVRKAFEVLLDFGPVTSFYTWMRWPIHESMDVLAMPLLTRFLTADEPVEFDDLVADVSDLLGQLGISPGYSSETSHVLDRLLTMLEQAGAIAQHDVVREQTKYGFAYRVGGTVTITPVGVELTVDLVRREGATIELISAPDSMSAQELAALTEDTDPGPAAWWEVTAEWLDAQQDPAGAAHELVDLLATTRDGCALLALILAPTPPSHADLLEPVMRQVAEEHPPPHERGSVSVNWLLTNGRIEPDQLPGDQLLDSSLSLFGLLAAEDPAMLPELLTDDRAEGSPLDVIAAVGARMPPHAEQLLDAIAHHHPDKVVTKAARKELFRVRSRLASQRAHRT
jgi:hypothetical protein